LLALNERRDLAVEVIHGVAVLSDAETKRFAMGLTRDLDAEAVAATARRNVVAKRADRDRRQAILEGARKELESQRERVKKAQETYTAAAKEVDLRETRIGAVRKKEDEAGIAVLKSQWTTLRPKLTEDQKKSATAKLEEARKETAKAVEEAKLPKQKLEAARIELELGNQTVDRLQGELLAQHWRRQTAETELVAAEAGAIQAEKTAETGCRDALAAGFAPGGKYIVSSHADGRLHVWRATDGSPVDTIPLKAAITQILPGDFGQVWLKSGTHGWLSVSLQPEWTLAHTLGSEKSDSPFADQVTALAFRADGTRLAAGSGEPTRTGDITVWEPVSGRLLYSVPALHSDTVLALAFSPDGWSLASGGADRFARIVDTTSAKATRALEGHTGHVLGVAWSPDGQRLATAGADSVVKLWDPQTGEKAKQAGGFSKEVTGVSYLAGRDRLVAASGENELRVLNENGEKVDSFKGLNDFTYSVGTTPDGKWIVAGGQDGVLRIWQSGKPEPVLQLTNQPVAALKTVFHAE
jgi:WD40 repeat protein